MRNRKMIASLGVFIWSLCSQVHAEEKVGSIEWWIHRKVEGHTVPMMKFLSTEGQREFDFTTEAFFNAKLDEKWSSFGSSCLAQSVSALQETVSNYDRTVGELGVVFRTALERRFDEKASEIITEEAKKRGFGQSIANNIRETIKGALNVEDLKDWAKDRRDTFNNQNGGGR